LASRQERRRRQAVAIERWRPWGDQPARGLLKGKRGQQETPTEVASGGNGGI
jgi:hypothetical protein